MIFSRSTRLTGIATWPGSRLVVRRGAPASDHPCALSRSRVVGQAGEPAAQLNGGGQLAAPIELGADRFDVGFGDREHRTSMAARVTASKRQRPCESGPLNVAAAKFARGPAACRRQIPTGTMAHGIAWVSAYARLGGDAASKSCPQATDRRSQTAVVPRRTRQAGQARTPYALTCRFSQRNRLQVQPVSPGAIVSAELRRDRNQKFCLFSNGLRRAKRNRDRPRARSGRALAPCARWCWWLPVVGRPAPRVGHISAFCGTGAARCRTYRWRRPVAR